MSCFSSATKLRIEIITSTGGWGGGGGAAAPWTPGSPCSNGSGTHCHGYYMLPNANVSVAWTK